MSEAPVTPLSVAPDAGRVILFGGTFDPPHRAHVELPLAARTLIEARDTEGRPQGKAWLVFVPAARSPHKRHGPEAADKDRLAMLQLALKDAGVGEGAADRIAIWTDEIDRARWGAEQGAGPAPSYMIETIRRAEHALRSAGAAGSPSAKLTLLIGADQALAFHHWVEYRGILDEADVFVLPRNGVQSGADLAERLRGLAIWSPQELARWRSAVLELPLREVAATSLRSWLRNPAVHDADLVSALGPGVLAYIRRHGLYGART